MPIAKIFSVRKLSNLKERRFLFGRLDAIIFKAIILSAIGIVFYACALVYTKINQFTNDGNGGVEEVTPRMAAAVGQSLAKKILIPVNKCDNIVIGTGGRPVAELIEEAVALILKAVNSGAY